MASPAPRAAYNSAGLRGANVDMRELARLIKQRAFLTGTFVLRSGMTTSYYWDKYRFESDPVLLRAIARNMLPLLPATFDKLAGLDLGGIPLATALSLESGKPSLYVRKEAKTYGTCNLVEGGYLPGERVVAIEDIVTSGGQVATSVQQMRDLGLIVEHAMCVVDREQGGRAKLDSIGCSLTSLFTGAEIDRLAASD